MTEHISADDPAKKPAASKAEQISAILGKHKRRRTLLFETESQKREFIANFVLFGVVAVLFGISYCSVDPDWKRFSAFGA